MNAVLLVALCSFMLGAAFMAVALWFRDQTADAERWGERLRLDPMHEVNGGPENPLVSAQWEAEKEASWRGLEDARVRIKPLKDWKKDGEL